MVKGQVRVVFSCKEDLLAFCKMCNITKYWYEITIERDYIAYFYPPALYTGLFNAFRDVYPDLHFRLLD